MGPMNRSTDEQPPQVWDPPTPTGNEREGQVLGPVALQLIAAGVAAVAATVLGVGVGWLAFAGMSNDCSPSDGWCGLGAALGGALVGLLVAVITYIVVGVLVIVTRREQGRRAVPITIHLAIPPAVVLTLTILGALAETLS